MWASFGHWWQDFKSGREGARYLTVFLIFLGWLIYESMTM